MRKNREETMVRIEDNYIFYTCLILVLAIAAFGIATDMINR